MKLNRLSLALAGISFFTVATAALAQQTVAPEDTKKSEKPTPTIQRVIVTGSNIKRIQTETASPILVISREEIVRGGATSLTEVLKEVAQNIGGQNENRTNGFTAGASSLNLRGIGSQATLTLINGRRLASYAQPEFQSTFVDLNSIPVGAVERIEILKDGASAIYGAEAMAGVVNIILRSNYEGAEISGSYGQSQVGDGQQARSSISYGFGNLASDRFNVYATIDVRRRKPMFLSNRDSYIGTDNLKPWGYKDSRSLYTGEGNLYWTDKATNAFKTITLNNNCPAANVLPGSEIFGPATTGNTCVFDEKKDGTFNSAGKTDRLGLTSRGTWQVTADTTAFAEVMLNQNKASVTGAYHWIAGQNGQQTPALPITHPQYPKELIDPVTGKTLAGGNGTVRVRATMKDLPGQGQDVTTDFSRYLVGVKGTVGKYDWETAAMYNESKVAAKSSAGLLATPFVNAYISGAYVIGATKGENAELYKSIVTNSRSTFKTSMALWDAKLTGELFQLPAGPLSFAAGVEARSEKLTTNPDPLAVAGELYHSAQLQGGIDRSRNTASIYTEMIIPLVKSVEASVAGRYDKYSDYGHSATPKLGLKWNVSPSFLVRGTYSTGFRAPTLVENSTQISKAFLNGFEDPERCNDKFKQGCQTSSAYESGSNPNLKPETAKSYTLGLVWEPTSWFMSKLDFWDIKREDEIGTYDLSKVLRDKARYGNDPAAVIVRNALTDADKAAGATAGEISLVRLLLTNVAMTQVRGVDLELKGRTNMGEYGKLTEFLNVSYMDSYKYAPSADDTPIEYIGTRGTPRLTANLGLGWTKAAWGVSADVSHMGQMDTRSDYTLPCSLATEGYPDLCGTLGSFTTVNFGASYSGFAKDLTVRLAIQNALNARPPFAPSSSSSYLNGLHSAMGRYFQVTVDYRFK
jgi:iron complex outermembrane receptor protein